MRSRNKNVFRKLVLLGTTIAVSMSACGPTGATQTETSPTPEPYFEVHEGRNKISHFPGNLPSFLRTSVVACVETSHPDNDCDDISDKPIRGLPVSVEYKKLNGNDPPHIIHTNESGFATTSKRKSADYTGRMQLGFPPINLSLVELNGVVTKVCGGRVTWETGDHQKLIFPYASKNCPGIQNSFEITHHFRYQATV